MPGPTDLEGIKVDANRAALNALGVQTAARFDGVAVCVPA